MKMPVEEYRKNPRITLPDYNSLEWQVNNATWGGPTDTFSMPTGIFKDNPACNDSDATFTFSIFDKMGRAFPRRRNMGFIRHIDWAVDCRIFSAAVAANVNPLAVTQENLETAADCAPEPKYMKENPIKYTCDHKVPEKARLVRRPLATWFSGMERGGVEVRHCVWWNEQFGATGAWDPNGCDLTVTDEGTTSCECHQFGAMTVVLEQAQIIQGEDDCELPMLIKYLGIGFSILTLLIFMGGTAFGKGVWDMFHALRLHIAFTWIMALACHIGTDLDMIRDNRTLNLIVGLAMKFFYTASCSFTAMECHATFKAFTSGIISGRTKVYYPFAYGTPLIPLGLLFLVFNDDLGLDPRCFVAWNWYAKILYLLWNLSFAFYAVVLAIIIIFNLTHAQTRRSNIVETLKSQAKGIVFVAFAKFIFWICATITYLHNPEGEMKDPYCMFIILLGWVGVAIFIALGPCSNKWRWGLCGKKKKVKLTQLKKNYLVYILIIYAIFSIFYILFSNKSHKTIDDSSDVQS
jgi:hypothetical protein